MFHWHGTRSSESDDLNYCQEREYNHFEARNLQREYVNQSEGVGTVCTYTSKPNKRQILEYILLCCVVSFLRTFPSSSSQVDGQDLDQCLHLFIALQSPHKNIT